MNFRTATLTSLLRPLLARLSPPRVLLDNERGQEDEMAALVRALDRSAPRDVEAWWPRFETALLEGLRARVWPRVDEITRVAAELRHADAATARSASNREEPPHIYELVVKYWNETRSALPGVAKPHHAERMVREGTARWGDLAWQGFPIPDERRRNEAAEENRARHDGVMFDLYELGLRLRANGYQARGSKGEMLPLKHWAGTVAPDDRYCENLRRARAANPLMRGGEDVPRAGGAEEGSAAVGDAPATG